MLGCNEEGNGAKPHIQRFMVLDISCRVLCKMSPTSIYRKKNKYKTKKDYLIFWNGICENDKYHYNKHEVPPQECEHDGVMVGNISWR